MIIIIMLGQRKGPPADAGPFTILYSTLLYSNLLYSTLLYYTILYYTIPYYTIIQCDPWASAQTKGDAMGALSCC